MTFKWSESVAAEKYHLQVASDKELKSLLLDRKDINGGEYKLAVEPGQKFRYQVSSDPQFASMAVDTVTPEPTAKFPKPPPGTHYLRLKSTDADGFDGPFGAAQKFVIPEPATPWWHYLPLLLLLAL